VKTLIHMVPRSGAQEELAARIRDLASDLRERLTAATVNVMLRLEDDPMGRRTPYHATLEIYGDTVDAKAVEGVVAGLGERLNDLIHADLTTLLLGEDVVFMAADCAPIRYQYLMRRNSRFSHEAYLERYREIHAQFGLRTPGIVGYVQFHVDPEASRRLAGHAGLGVWGVDSVSELHLHSLETFLSAIAESTIGRESMADEEIFVDRACSYDFCSTVE